VKRRKASSSPSPGTPGEGWGGGSRGHATYRKGTSSAPNPLPNPPRERGQNPLTLALSASTGKQYLPYLRRHLPSAATFIRTHLTDLSVILVGDKRMAELHLQFMNIPGPTDVLTFPIDEDSRGRPTAGEVYVCIPEAIRQSKLRKTKVRDEVLLYALHGLLHLSGFDDRTDAEYRRMHRTEDDILSRLGIGRVFAPLPSEIAIASPAARKPPHRRRPTKPNHRPRGDR
jgi:probable rRNA maturation factor